MKIILNLWYLLESNAWTLSLWKNGTQNQRAVNEESNRKQKLGGNLQSF